LCKGVTDSDIKRAIEDGASSFREVRDLLGVATNCGSCACAAKKLVHSSAKEVMNAEPNYYQLA